MHPLLPPPTIGSPTSPLLGFATLAPTVAARTGAYALRTTHTQQGRTMALWGFWRGVRFLLSTMGPLIAVIGMRMQG